MATRSCIYRVGRHLPRRPTGWRRELQQAAFPMQIADSNSARKPDKSSTSQFCTQQTLCFCGVCSIPFCHMPWCWPSFSVAWGHADAYFIRPAPSPTYKYSVCRLKSRDQETCLLLSYRAIPITDKLATVGDQSIVNRVTSTRASSGKSPAGGHIIRVTFRRNTYCI